MLWQGRRESENVEDARGSGGGGRIVLGGGIGTVILVVLYLLLGGDPQALFQSQQAQLPQSAQFDNQAPRDEASKFDSFTHGTPEQRARWFRRGYETGDLSQGDTFNTRDL